MVRLSTFEVRAKKLKNYAEDEKKIQKKLTAFQQEITACQKNLGKVLSVSEDHIQQNLKALNQNIGKEAKLIGQMATVLDSISNRYLSTEREIEGTKINIKDPGQISDIGGNLFIDGLKDIGIGTLDEFGIGGSVTGITEDINNDEFTTVKKLKFLAKFVKATAKQIEDPKNWQENFFGFSNEGTTGAWNYIKEDLEGYAFDSAKTGVKGAASKIATVAKWGGVILTGVESFVGNQEEFKDKGGMKNPRFWKETALETTLNVAKGVGVGAAVAAVGITSWPAVAITGVVIAGGDVISNMVFHKDLTEAVSDGIIDLDEEYGFSDKVIEGMEFNSTVKSIGNAQMKPESYVMSRWALPDGGGGSW